MLLVTAQLTTILLPPHSQINALVWLLCFLPSIRIESALISTPLRGHGNIKYMVVTILVCITVLFYLSISDDLVARYISEGTGVIHLIQHLLLTSRRKQT